MSDTPETDEEFARLGKCKHPVCGELVTASFARKLEQERNEARQHVRELVETWYNFWVEREDGTVKTFAEAIKAAKHYLQSVTS